MRDCRAIYGYSNDYEGGTRSIERALYLDASTDRPVHMDIANSNNKNWSMSLIEKGQSVCGWQRESQEQKIVTLLIGNCNI
jgi:hypothetical protein